MDKRAVFAEMPNPLALDERRIHRVDPGGTVEELLRAIDWREVPGATTRVVHNGKVLAREAWPTTTVADRDILSVTAVPGFEGLAAVGVWLLANWEIVAAVVVIVGAAVYTANVINSLMADGGGGGFRPSATLMGAGNEIREFEPIPAVYGRHRLFPPHGAFPYTEEVGNTPFGRLLFLISHGPLTMSEIMVGDLDLNTVNFPDGQWFVREGRTTDGDLQLFADTVSQDFFKEPFPIPAAVVYATYVSGYKEHTSVDDVGELAVTLEFDGLFRIDDHGGPTTFSFFVDIEYKNISGGSPADWAFAWNASNFTGYGGDGNPQRFGSSIRFQDYEREAFRKTFRWSVEQGQYKVQIRRRSIEPWNAYPGGPDSQATVGSFTWTSLKSFQLGVSSFDVPSIATLEVRIPLDQHSGFSNDLSVLVQRELKVYDPYHLLGGAWDSDDWTTTYHPSRNAAAALRDVYQGTINPRPLTNSRIDIPALSAWHENNEPPMRYDCDDLTGVTGFLGTVSTETTIKVEGTGSVKNTAGSLPAATQFAVASADSDFTDTVIKCGAYLPVANGSTITATTGITVTIRGSDFSWYEQWHFGSDHGVVEDAWFLIELDVGEAGAPDVTVGAPDRTAIEIVAVTFNINNTTAGDLLYLDPLYYGHRRKLDVVIDAKLTASELARAVARTARADIDVVNGKVSVWEDQPNKTPVQLITARNANSVSMIRRYDDHPHCLIVRHVNPEEGYEPRWETRVYDDDESGVTYDDTTATRYEELNLFGAWTPNDVWREVRTLMARARLRPRVIQAIQDLEMLAVRRGDLVLFAHDAALIGTSWGRVKTVEVTSRFDSQHQDGTAVGSWVTTTSETVVSPAAFGGPPAHGAVTVVKLTTVGANTGDVWDTASFSSDSHVNQFLRLWVYLPSQGTPTESGTIAQLYYGDGTRESTFDFAVGDLARDEWVQIECDLEATADSVVTNHARSWEVAKVGFRFATHDQTDGLICYLASSEWRDDVLVLPVGSGGVVVGRCDHPTPTYWARVNVSGTTLDTGDKQQGDGSIEGTASAAFLSALQAGIGPHDIADTTVKIWVAPEAGSYLDTDDGIRIELLSSANDWAIWNFGTDADKGDLSEGSWTELSFDPSGTPSSSSGVLDLTAVTGFYVIWNVTGAASGRVLNFDHIRFVENTDLAEITSDNVVTFNAGYNYRAQVRVVSSAPALELEQLDIVNPVEPGGDPIDSGGLLVVRPYAAGTLPSVGDLLAAGQTTVETREMLVNAIRPDTELQATIELVDYSPAIFDAETGTIPTFTPGSSFTIPSKFIGPMTPVILGAVSDETALKTTDEGSLVPRIIVTLSPQVESELSPQPLVKRPITESYLAQYRRNDPAGTYQSDWRSVPLQLASKGRVIVDDVHEGFTYDVRIRAVSADGRASGWAILTAHTVAGMSALPPDLATFRIEGRRLAWSLPIGETTGLVYEPPDLAGFRIRMISGSTPLWNSARAVHHGVITETYYDLDAVPRGQQSFLIKAEDKAGNQSANALSIIVNLGDQDVENIILTTDFHAGGFTRVSDENVVLFDDCDAVTGWTESTATFTIETEETVDGVGAFKLAYNATAAGYVGSTPAVSDWTGKTFRWWMNLDALTLAAGTGFEVYIGSSPTDYRRWDYGSDDIGEGGWSRYEITVDVADNDGSSGSWVPTAIDFVRFAFVGQSSGDFFLVDEIHLLGGGDFETTEVEGGSGDLITMAPGNLFWGDPGAVFWGTAGKTFYETAYQQGTWRFEYTPAGASTPSQLTWEHNDLGVPFFVEYIVPGTDVFVPWPGQLEVTNQLYTFRLAMGGGPTIGRVTQWDAKLDVPDIVEYHEDVSILATGTQRLPPTATFRAYVSVTVTVQDASNAYIVRVTEKSNLSLGPIVEVVDTGNNRVAATIDAIVKGY